MHGAKCHIKMLYDEQFSRYLRFLLIIGNYRKLTETSGNLRRTRVFKSSNDIPHYIHGTYMSWKIRSKMLYDASFPRKRQLPQMAGNFRTILNPYDRRINSFQYRTRMYWVEVPHENALRRMVFEISTIFH